MFPEMSFPFSLMQISFRGKKPFELLSYLSSPEGMWARQRSGLLGSARWAHQDNEVGYVEEATPDRRHDKASG